MIRHIDCDSAEEVRQVIAVEPSCCAVRHIGGRLYRTISSDGTSRSNKSLQATATSFRVWLGGWAFTASQLRRRAVPVAVPEF